MKFQNNPDRLARDIFTDADYFGIEFPMDLDVQMTAVLLDACMLAVSNYLHSRYMSMYIYLWLLFYNFRNSCFMNIREKSSNMN